MFFQGTIRTMEYYIHLKGLLIKPEMGTVAGYWAADSLVTQDNFLNFLL